MDGGKRRRRAINSINLPFLIWLPLVVLRQGLLYSNQAALQLDRLELLILLPPPPKDLLTLPSWVDTVLGNESCAWARHSTTEMQPCLSTLRSVCQYVREVQSPCRWQTAVLCGERGSTSAPLPAKHSHEPPCFSFFKSL